MGLPGLLSLRYEKVTYVASRPGQQNALPGTFLDTHSSCELEKDVKATSVLWKLLAEDGRDTFDLGLWNTASAPSQTLP